MGMENNEDGQGEESLPGSKAHETVGAPITEL